MSSKREDEVKAVLETIRKKNKGRLTKQAVVAYANKNRESVLGKMFNWDAERAAMQHWLDRAGEIISRYITVVIVDRSLKVRVPYYVSDPTAPTNEGGYTCVLDKHTRTDATTIITNELDRCIGAIERARDVAFALDKQHRGLSEAMQKMLVESVTWKERLSDAA